MIQVRCLPQKSGVENLVFSNLIIELRSVLDNNFNGISNKWVFKYKLIQFQYKLLVRISTCKYMRFKMHK